MTVEEKEKRGKRRGAGDRKELELEESGKLQYTQYTIKNFEAELRDGPFFGIDSLSFHFPI